MNKNAPSIFVPMIGQYENIGDIILRRPLLDWLRPFGTLHVFVGGAPGGYEAGLGLRSGDRVYRSFVAWYFAGLREAVLGSAHYVFKPGEIQLTLKGLKEHLSVLPMIAGIRARGGKVIRLGSGARNFSALPRLLMMPSIQLSNLVMWRDARTARYMGVGEVMPDLAFCEGDSENMHLPSKDRDVLVVSMRGDRDQKSATWEGAVRAYASARGLKIWVVTQVERDSALSKSLAAKLGAELLDWDGSAHERQEDKLRALYRKSHGVISDRLHVLISAYSHGAVPIGLLAYSSDKIQRHFDVLGVKNIAIHVAGLGEGEVLESMEALALRRDEILSALVIGRQRLEEVRGRLASLIAPQGVMAMQVSGRARG